MHAVYNKIGDVMTHFDEWTWVLHGHFFNGTKLEYFMLFDLQ
jgi:hypothetical protein